MWLRHGSTAATALPFWTPPWPGTRLPRPTYTHLLPFSFFLLRSCKIMEHLIQRWRIADLTGLNPKAAEAQEFVCNLPARIRRLAERKTGEWFGGCALLCARALCSALRSREATGQLPTSAAQASRMAWLTWDALLAPHLPPAVRKAKTQKEPVRFSWLYGEACGCPADNRVD